MASVKERNGHYTVTVSLGYDISGKKLTRSKTFTPDPKLTPAKIRKAVNAFADEFERQVLNNEIPQGDSTTLKELVEKWFDYQTTTGKLQPRTIEGYKQELEAKILPALGHKYLTELRPANLTEFFLALSKDGVRKDGKAGGYSKSSIKKVQNVLSSILQFAVDQEYLSKNPVQNKTVRNIGDAPPPKCMFFSNDEAVIFLTYLDERQTYIIKGHRRVDDTGKEYAVEDHERTTELPEQIKILLILAIYTGMRKGELLALEWSDFDYENNTVTVSKSCSYVNHQQITKCPKTKAGNRVITIPAFLTERIRKMETERKTYIKALGDRWEGADWLFIQENGKQMCYFTPGQTLKKIINRYNSAHEDQIPLIPFHGLRHTSATLMAASMVDLRTMMERLGHAHFSTLMNIYVHATKENEIKAAHALEEALRGKKIKA